MARPLPLVAGSYKRPLCGFPKSSSKIGGFWFLHFFIPLLISFQSVIFCGRENFCLMRRKNFWWYKNVVLENNFLKLPKLWLKFAELHTDVLNCKLILVFPNEVELLYVQEVVTQPKILNRTFLYNLVHVT